MCLLTNRSKTVFASPISASEIPAVTNANRWTIIGLLFVASLINYFDRATISMALPLLSSEFKLGPQEKGMLLSSFFWSYAILQIPVGWLTDRINLRWMYAGAFAIWSIAQGLMGWAETLTMLITLRVLLGVGESIYLPGGSKIVSLLFTAEKRGLPSGIFDFGTRTGLVLEGLLVPWCLHHYGWRHTFLIVGFSALLWLIPWLSATPQRLKGNAGSKFARGQRPATSRQIRSVLRSRNPLGISLGFFRALWRMVIFIPTRRNLLGICLGFFCFDYYWYLLVTWLPDYLVTVRHLTILKAGFYSALPFFVFGVSEPVGGWIADRLVSRGWNETRTRKAVVTVAFATGLLLIPAAIVSRPGAAVALIIGGSLVGLATGNLLVILQLCAPPDDIGLWTGIENFAGNLAGVLAPLATGFLIALTGSYFPAFALATVVLVYRRGIKTAGLGILLSSW